MIEAHSGYVTAGEPDYEIAACPGHAAQLFTDIAASDGVEDHFYTPPISRSAHSSRQRFDVAMVQHSVRTQSLSESTFFRTTRNCNHRSPSGFGDLDRGGSSTSRRPEDEN